MVLKTRIALSRTVSFDNGQNDDGIFLCSISEKNNGADRLFQGSMGNLDDSKMF